MGSGSSKKSPPPAKKTAPPNPVANVNKQEQERGREQIDAEQTPLKDADNAKRNEEDEYNNNKKQEREKEKERIKKMKMEEKQEREKEKENKKKMKMDEKSKENMLTFEDDSDLDNDIDEVLKMPMAIEYSKSKKKNKKEKKDKGKKTEEVMNYDNKLERDLFNSNSNEYSRNEDLPETYAQRLQRKQYKLQQDMLIRQKTMHRNANEWNDFDDEEDENFKNQGFDASKFRAANKGGDTKKDLFKTSSGQEELETPRYLQSDQDNMDDFQVGNRPTSPNRALPSYNQSEIDLMNELERDLL